MELRPAFETIEGEYLKTAAEFALHGLAKFNGSERLFNLARGGERIEDARLAVTVAGIEFENPLVVGAGWDKKGWAVDGLYALGFAGTEVGSVLVFDQKGNPRPRLWYKDGIGLNRMGFNSKGEDAVEAYLSGQNRSGVTGISIGKNKLMPDTYAPWAHAEVARKLVRLADYYVVNVASPNTPGLRNLLKKEPLTDIVTAVKEAAPDTPLFIKTTVDLALADLDDILEICDEQGAGIIDSNTTIEEKIKARYGWSGQMGGVSGDDGEFRAKATERMKHITRETRDTDIARIGVGGIHDTATALERLQAGAQVVQVVTGIRQHKGRIARDINLGIVRQMERDGVNSVEEYVGVAA